MRGWLAGLVVSERWGCEYIFVHKCRPGVAAPQNPQQREPEDWSSDSSGSDSDDSDDG